MPKEIGNCECCDATLWDDGVASKNNITSYGGNEEFCGDCLQDEREAQLKEDLKKEVKKLRLQLKVESPEELYIADKNFVWAMQELLEGRSIRRDIWSGKPGSYDYIKFVGVYVILSRESEREITPKDETAHHVKTILITAHFKKISINGVIDMGWCPTVYDMIANDWGPGYPDMKKIEEKILTDRKK